MHKKQNRRGITTNTSGHKRTTSLIEPLEHRTLLSVTPQLLDAPVAAAASKPVVTIAPLSTARSKAKEGVRNGYLKVMRSGGNISAPLAVSVSYSGWAKNGVDYKTLPTSVVIAPGKTSATITVVPINDTKVERTEDVKVTLGASSAYTIGTASIASAQIYDNDGALINFTATTPATTEGSSSPAIFTFTRKGLLDKSVRVLYTIKGTAVNGHDYTTIKNYVDIPAKKGKVSVTINTIDDLKPGPDTTVSLALANGFFQAGTSWKATATIHDSAAPDPANGNSFAAGTQFIVFRGPDTSTQPGHVFRAVAQGGSSPVDISKSLNDLGYTGVDTAINISPNAKWIVLHTSRFGGTTGTSSLAILRSDNIDSGQQILVNGSIIPATDGPSAVSNDGNTVVYASTDGPHSMDLWAVQFAAGQWTTHILTGTGWAYDYNIQPAISADGTKVVFAAGNAAGDTGTEAIAQVNVDGSGIQTLVTRANAPIGSKADAYLNHPAFGTAAGSVVFGANFNSGTDQLWRWATGQPTASLASSATSEMSPAVFSDGRIASLWRNREGNTTHVLELTLREADGSYRGTIAPGVDLPISGIGVGTWPQDVAV